MAPPDPEAWSGATARKPAQFALAKAPDNGVQHAYADGSTLCGISDGSVTVYRTLFRADSPSACARCQQLAGQHPTDPCVQERLLSAIGEAAPAPLRDDLSRALRRGANVRLWINGPAASLVRHYANLEHIVEGSADVAAALPPTGSIGLARVEDGPDHYLVILPPGGSPGIGRLLAG